MSFITTYLMKRMTMSGEQQEEVNESLLVEDVAASNRAIVIAMNVQNAQEDKGNRQYNDEERRYQE